MMEGFGLRGFCQTFRGHPKGTLLKATLKGDNQQRRLLLIANR
jgi:hypothetical protein